MEPLPNTLPTGEDTNLADNERLSKWGVMKSSEVIHRGHPQLVVFLQIQQMKVWTGTETAWDTIGCNAKSFLARI